MNNDATSSNHHDPRPDRIRSAFAEMPLPPVPSPDETFARVMAAANDPPAGNVPAASSSGPRPSALRIVMRIASPLAAAAAIAVLLYVLLSPGGGSTAFAQVQERLGAMQTVALKMTITGAGDAPIIGRTQVKDGGGVRTTYTGPEGDTVVIRKAGDPRELTLLPEGRATLIDLGDGLESQLNPVETLLRREGWDPEPAGRDVVAGRSAVRYRFEAEEEGFDGEVWVDEETGLPLVTRFVYAYPSGMVLTTEMTDYAWDLPLDDGLFDLQVPEGYSLGGGDDPGGVVSSVESVLKASGEADFLRLLNLWATVAGGPFPDAVVDSRSASASVSELIEAPEGIERLQGWAAKSLGVDELTPAQFNDYLASGFTKEMTWGFVFLATTAMPQGFEWHGQGAELGQADRVICFWRNGPVEDGSAAAADAGYRVVYGDLRVETLPDAPVLP